jgi:high affinity sulfate transporter 1
MDESDRASRSLFPSGTSLSPSRPSCSPSLSPLGDAIPPLPESGVASLFPGLWVLRHYRRAWLARDVGAGLVLTALLVPAGMGYATASGLPAVTGLYATIAALFAYAVFGPSRVMVLGPDSALTALIAAAIAAAGDGTPERAIALASALALLTGAICLVAGLGKLGFLTDLLSKPVRVGFMNGIVLTIVVSQLPKLFGFSTKTRVVADGAIAFARGVADGRTSAPALVIGGACLLLILGVRAKWPRAPGVLFAVVLATAAVTALGLEGRVEVVGVVPRGVPLPTIPAVGLHDAAGLVVSAAGIAMVAFADTSVLSRSFAARHRYRVDPNRELIGLGVANVCVALFRGFPISSSSSRTPVAESAGSRTQVTGVAGATAIVLLLAIVPSLLRNLPTASLAAVVIAAVLQIFDARALRVFYRVRRSDFHLSVVAFLAVAILGVLWGIAIAVSVSLLDFVRRAWRPHDAILGRAPGVKGYHDVTRYPDAKQIPGLLLFRWDAPLFFANADAFRARVLDALDAAEAPVRWVVVAAEPITDVDTTAAEMLEELDKELARFDVELAFAELKDPVKDRLERYGLKRRIGRDFFFPTIGVAVKAFRDRQGVAWVDWEDAN